MLSPYITICVMITIAGPLMYTMDTRITWYTLYRYWMFRGVSDKYVDDLVVFDNSMGVGPNKDIQRWDHLLLSVILW